MAAAALKRAISKAAQATLGSVPLPIWERAFPKDVLAVCYHMVSGEDLDHFRLLDYKNPGQFAADVAFAKGRAASYDEVVGARLNGARMQPNRVLFTFDDGLAECFEVARPVLRSAEVPAVFFVTTSFIDDARPFPESVVSLCLTAIERMSHDGARKLAASIDFREPPDGCKAQMVVLRSKLAAARLSPIVDPFKRRMFLWVLAAAEAGEDEIDRACKLLNVDVAGYFKRRQVFLSADQIRTMHAEGFTIGAHGVEHRSLAGRSHERIAQEILSSCDAIRQITGQRRVPFAFPYEGLSIERSFLADLLARNPFVELIFDSGCLRADAPFVVNRVFADAPCATAQPGVVQALRSAWAGPSAWHRPAPHRGSLAEASHSLAART